MSSSISAGYPASTTTNSSRLSSTNLMRVSSASLPNESLASFTSAYASSTNSMPPTADSTTSCVLMAVCPTNGATIPDRSVSTKWPRFKYPSPCSSSAIMRAMVVLPVPGLPLNTMCIVAFTLAPCTPAIFFFSASCSCATRLRTCFFTPARPITASSFASTDSMFSPDADVSSSVKSASAKLRRLSLDLVPDRCTRSVCLLIAASTSRSTNNLPPLSAAHFAMGPLSSSSSFSLVRSLWIMNPLSSVATRTKAAISSGA
mmetsp:Transcript_54780/g.108713  ORF Transcript_54780/g.108713 Transcript_54780/m.108713 type:complete len:260 (-) Transcript_54780:376-1155(-)